MAMTIDLSCNLLSIIVGIIGIGVTIGTWYFTRRHYVKVSREPTANDVAIQESKTVLWIVAIPIVGILLVGVLIVAITALSPR